MISGGGTVHGGDLNLFGGVGVKAPSGNVNLSSPATEGQSNSGTIGISSGITAKGSSGSIAVRQVPQ